MKSPSVLDELESHLRDEVETQLRLGLTELQAFEIAVERIGPIKTLGREFTEEQRLINAALFGCAGLYSLVGCVPVLFKLGSFSDITSTQQISAVTAVVITALSLLSGRFFARIAPVICDKRLRTLAYVAGIFFVGLWLLFFYRLVMTRLEWDMSQLVVAILWAWIPMAVLCGTILGMERAAVARTPKAHV